MQRFSTWSNQPGANVEILEDTSTGWEHDRYEAACGNCGKTGTVIISSDDWGRNARSYEGFENVDPAGTAVGRMRQDRSEMNGRCAYGSTSIIKGAFVRP